MGGTGVSWSPAASPGSLVSAKGSAQPEKRLASCGCDKTVKVLVLSTTAHSDLLKLLRRCTFASSIA